MRFRACAALWALCVLAQCTSSQGPGPLASDSLAVALFVDLHHASARQELNLPTPGHAAILADYGLDSTSFGRLMDFYARHPDRYSAMYAQVVDRLGASEMRVLR